MGDGRVEGGGSGSIIHPVPPVGCKEGHRRRSQFFPCVGVDPRQARQRLRIRKDLGRRWGLTLIGLRVQRVQRLGLDFGAEE